MHYNELRGRKIGNCLFSMSRVLFHVILTFTVDTYPTHFVLIGISEIFFWTLLLMRLHQNYKASYYEPSTYFKCHLCIVTATTFTSRCSISIYCTRFCSTVNTSSIQWNKLWLYNLFNSGIKVSLLSFALRKTKICDPGPKTQRKERS